MANEKKHSEIIFVNSFKGGAGKTTLALTHCIDELFHRCKFENIIYIDLDILGTATTYLFEKDKLPMENAFNNARKEVKIDLTYENESKPLYVVYLSPEFKARSSYGGLDYVNHQDIARQQIQDDIFTYVSDILKKGKNNLIVFDCAPGFSKMEQKLLEKCYDMKFRGWVEVKEEYVVTLDTGHIEKSIQCIRDSWNILETSPEYRNIRMTLNDIQNYYQYLESDLKADVEQRFQRITDSIKERLQAEGDVQPVEIFFWRYSKEIAMRSIFMNQTIVENQPEHYIMTEDSYKKII